MVSLSSFFIQPSSSFDVFVLYLLPFGPSRTKREIFHILLAKFLCPFTLSSERDISFSTNAPQIIAIRRASAPYFSAISMGSITFPLDFEILSPSLSRTRP